MTTSMKAPSWRQVTMAAASLYLEEEKQASIYIVRDEGELWKVRCWPRRGDRFDLVRGLSLMDAMLKLGELLSAGPESLLMELML